MNSATEGRKRGASLRLAIAWAICAVAFSLSLSIQKDSRLKRWGAEKQAQSAITHVTAAQLFQSSYFFYFDDRFQPGIRLILDEAESARDLDAIRVFDASGVLIFEQKRGEPTFYRKDPNRIESGSDDVKKRIQSKEPGLLIQGFGITVLRPAGEYALGYVYHAQVLQKQIVREFLQFILISGIAVMILAWMIRNRSLSSLLRRARERGARVWGLQAKFLLTILLINLITGGIVWVSLSALQGREEYERLRKDAILFARFSSSQVVSDFSTSFNFYFKDRFLPRMRSMIAANENLVAIRIISGKNGAVLFDTEDPEHPPKEPVGQEVLAELKTRDLLQREMDRGGLKLFSIVQAWREEGALSSEPMFLVEYWFTFQSLAGSVELIRRQILMDLGPSLLISILIAAVFAQWLIAPIKKLRTALQRVTSGEYDVSVDVKRTDETGELIRAFNRMTFELRKKQELRKFLSDSTYRQIMDSAERAGSTHIGGSRVQAAILFSDIRDFVSHCESLEAEEVTAMLNEYFAAMVEVVYRNGGEVDKFIGDAILAVFYTRGTESSTALQAIYCAMEMRERLEELNRKRISQQKRPIAIGVGITYGEIISGPIGAKDRMDFTVIGDVVNLANRIEKLSKKGRHTKIVFSDQVENKVRGLLDSELLSKEPIRGKSEEVQVYELIRIRELGSLLEQMRVGDLALKRRSIELLGHSRNRDAIPHLLEALGDADEESRMHSVIALSKLAPQNDPVILDSLFARLPQESSEKMVSTVISAIGRICSTDRILKLAPYLEARGADADRIIANTIEAMGHVKDPRCSDLILPKLSSRHNRIKANAAMALFAAGHIEVVATLKPMLMHSDPLMRSSAAFAIGELTILAQTEPILEVWKVRAQSVKFFLGELQDCVPMLISALRDSDPMVKRQAIIALGKIKDKSAVLPLIDHIEDQKDTREMIEEVAQALRSIGSHRLVREVISKLT